MNRVFLLTGSNLGDSVTLMKRAVELTRKQLGVIVKKSHVYQSESWGYKSSKPYFNQCIEVESELSPLSILDKILEIETKMGRTRSGKGYSDRKIDIDILFYGAVVMEEQKLVIPHPRMHLRRFALLPMSEIAGDFMHPLLKRTISELLINCPDESLVTIAY